MAEINPSTETSQKWCPFFFSLDVASLSFPRGVWKRERGCFSGRNGRVASEHAPNNGTTAKVEIMFDSSRAGG